jgi:hypothetical protein
VVFVGRLLDEDAMTMLRQAAVDKESLEDHPGTSELLAELDDLQPAITQAAAYIDFDEISISECLETICSTERRRCRVDEH